MTAEIDMNIDLGGWKQEPVSPDWFELDDWADYGDTAILEDINCIIKEEPQVISWPENGTYDNYSNISGNEESSSIGWVEEAKTSQLLQEFEDVLSRALTPPDSPKHGISPPQQQTPIYFPPSFLQLEPTTQGQLTPPQQQSIQQEQIVPDSGVSELDALVVESLGNGDCTSSSDSGYEDPDWAPISNKARTRPYPSVEERKARKKEQNKNAATRYRQKKKQEVEVVLSEEKGLQDKNDSLKAEVEEVAREIKYLKSLMRHMFKAKGLIS